MRFVGKLTSALRLSNLILVFCRSRSPLLKAASDSKSPFEFLASGTLCFSPLMPNPPLQKSSNALVTRVERLLKINPKSVQDVASAELRAVKMCTLLKHLVLALVKPPCVLVVEDAHVSPLFCLG